MEKKLSFKQKMMIEREALIIETVNHLLSTKGFDAMTIDEVAETVGIGKPSLYRHFPSKEALGVAALLDVMAKTHQRMLEIDAHDISALDKLKALVRWAMQIKLDQQMPNLPSENSALVAHLKSSKTYVDGLITLSDHLGQWIEQAQTQGNLNPKLPGLVILYTLYARACDPVLTFLKHSGLYDDDTILDMVTQTCFDGL